MLQHVHAYLRSPNGLGVKEVLDNAVLHVPELLSPPGVTSKSTVLDTLSGKSGVSESELKRFANNNIHHIVDALKHHIGRGEDWASYIDSLKSKIIPGYKDPLVPIAGAIKHLRDSIGQQSIQNPKLLNAADSCLKPLTESIEAVDLDSTPLNAESIRAFITSLPTIETKIKSNVDRIKTEKTEDHYDHSRNRHETLLGSELHNWSDPAVDMAELDQAVVSPEFHLFGHKYPNKSAWESDKKAFDGYVGGIVSKVQDLVSKSSTLKIKPS
jgi:hypothetical protein